MCATSFARLRFVVWKRAGSGPVPRSSAMPTIRWSRFSSGVRAIFDFIPFTWRKGDKGAVSPTAATNGGAYLRMSESCP